jgi:hypothetical protein
MPRGSLTSTDRLNTELPSVLESFSLNYTMELTVYRLAAEIAFVDFFWCELNVGAQLERGKVAKTLAFPRFPSNKKQNAHTILKHLLSVICTTVGSERLNQIAFHELGVVFDEGVGRPRGFGLGTACDTQYSSGKQKVS